MKTYSQKASDLTALLFLIPFVALAQVSVEFEYTGAAQEWVVPEGITEIQVDAYGASGTISPSGSPAAGLGGRVQGTLAVNPGETLYIYVGGSHPYGASNWTEWIPYSSPATATMYLGTFPQGRRTSNGGWNGGGTVLGAQSVSSGSLGGGGATDIRIGWEGPMNYDGEFDGERVIVAGGGGGGGYKGGAGGAGGGLTGGSGSGPGSGAQGGTQSKAGETAGSNGEYGSMWPPASWRGYGAHGGYGDGGPGGGGYFGGGGSGNGGGGGGGSSYTNNNLVTNVEHTRGVRSGNGFVAITHEYVDQCGVIDGDNSSCTDECGIINGDNSSCADQCGVPNGDNSSCTDECGVVNGDNESCADVCGVPNGSGYYYAYIDTDGDGLGEGDLIESCSDLILGSSYVSSGGDTEITGCTNAEADNYLPSANTDDGSCIITGCTDSNYAEYNENANTEDGSCSCPIFVEVSVGNASCDLTDGTASVSGLQCSSMITDSWHQMLVDRCLEGDDPLACIDAHNYASDDLPSEMRHCFSYGHLSECEAAVEFYPEEMASFLGEADDSWHEMLIDRCLEGDDPLACIDAHNYASDDLPSEMRHCFSYGHLSECEAAVEFYPEEMASFLGGTSCYSWTDSEGLELSEEASVSNLSAGTYSFNYSNGDCNYSQSFEVGLSCSGCTDVEAFNYNENANVDDGNCVAVINGCMDAEAFNYNSAANTNDDSCTPVVNGCLDETYMEFNSDANTNDGSCEVLIVYGCMDATPNLMSNFNPDANVDDASCVSWQKLASDLQGQLDNVTHEDGVSIADVEAATPLSMDIPISLPEGWSMFGYTCLEPLDVIDGFVSVKESLEIVKDEMGLAYLPDYNFNAIGDLKHGEGYQIKLTNSIDDFQFCKTLVSKVFGCTDANAFNYMAEANTEDDSCIPVLTGCMDEGAFNFDAAANTDDDSCIAKVFGCTNSAATNYEDVANTDDSSCIILGCIDEAAFNYDVSANTNDGSCVAKVLGCTNSSALNYDASANTNDDTCLEIGSSFEGGVIFYLDGNGGALIAAPSDQSTSAIWGCPGTLIGTSSEVGSGSQNTLNMVAGCTASGGHGPKAANICSELTLGGYNDWYLPSVDELALIEQNISGLNTSYPNFYWSSTEYDSDKASQYVGGGGYINNNGKQWTGVVRAIRSVSLGCTDPSASNYNASATTDDASCIVECVLPAFMTSASDFESPSITSGEVLYVYYDNTYITHFTTSSSSIVTGSTPGYSGNGPRYSDEDYGTGAVQPGVNYYAGTLSSLTSINEANYPYWVGAGDEYIFDTRSFENGGETYDGVGNFSWTNWTNKNLKISKTQVVCGE